MGTRTRLLLPPREASLFGKWGEGSKQSSRQEAHGSSKAALFLDPQRRLARPGSETACSSVAVPSVVRTAESSERPSRASPLVQQMKKASPGLLPTGQSPRRGGSGSGIWVSHQGTRRTPGKSTHCAAQGPGGHTKNEDMLLHGVGTSRRRGQAFLWLIIETSI